MADAPAPAPMGDLFATYNPQGAADGLFAPAYINGYQPSQQAVTDWSAKHHTDPSVIDQTRMAQLWNPPDVTQTAPGVWAPSSGGGMIQGNNASTYGEGRIPQNLSFGLDKGIVDPAALKAVAQGTAYTMGDDRRAAIAERLMYNEGAKDAYQMRANARGEPGLTGGKINDGGYGSGALYSQYMKQNNPSGFNEPLIINNNPGGGGYISGPTDNWPNNVPGNPSQGGGMGGSASNLNLIRPWEMNMIQGGSGGDGGEGGE